MILTIWRHGQAEDGSSDRQRALTASGRDDIAFGCHQFNEACYTWKIPQPDRILHSAWLRTTQTAEIVAGAFSHATQAAESSLQPPGSIGGVTAVLSSLIELQSTDEHIVLVSHQPLVSQLVDHYLGESGAAPGLPPGGLVTLSMDYPSMGSATLLFWAFPPEYEAGV